MKPEGRGGLYTERQLWMFYVRFNEIYFGNKLPRRVQIGYADELPQEHPDAVACVERYCVFGEGCYDLYHIRFLRDFFRGKHPHLILCSLLHEMVHVYVHRSAGTEPKDHGPLFKAACENLQRLGWNVDSFLNPNVCAFELRDRRPEASRPFLGVIGFGGRFVRELLKRR